MGAFCSILTKMGGCGIIKIYGGVVMIEQIDMKYLKQRRENGDIYIKWGTWVDKHEQKVVKEPVPVIGKIFPFIKRKKTIDVVVGKEGPVVMESNVQDMININNPAYQNLLKNVPYTKIVDLDESIYGKGLHLAFVADKTGEKVWDGEFHIVTNEGVIIGKFNDDMVKGYYNPNMHHVLPKDYLGTPTSGSGSDNIGLEEIVSAYCAKNPDAKNCIPTETRKQFPELMGKVDEAIASAKGGQKTNSDGGKV